MSCYVSFIPVICRKIFCSKIIVLLIFSLLFTGCADMKQTATAIGTGVGGSIGYLLTKDSSVGAQIAGVAAGMVVGAVIGGVIGNYMEKSDQEKVQRELRAASTGQERHWTNPKTGHRFTIKPIDDIKMDGQGREYRTATVWGKKKGSDKTDVTTEKIYLEHA